jgi:hypothetical protein
MVSRAPKAFNDAGELTDDSLRAQLQEFLRDFAAFAATP